MNFRSEFVSLRLKFFFWKLIDDEWFLSMSIKSSIWLSIKILGKLGIERRFIKNFENVEQRWKYVVEWRVIRLVLVEFYRVK